MARKRKLAAAVFSLGCLHASSLMALGLGELELDSFLNEPLNASVDLLKLEGLNEDQIRVRLASSEDFSRMGVERLYFLTTLKFDVITGGPDGPRIVISTDKPVLEPYLDFIVEARWPSGRLLREYTVLIDPPVYSEAPTVISASERVYETEGIPEPGSAESPPTGKTVGLFPEGDQRGAGGSTVKTTGTRIDVRDSNLAPGAMPQRNFNANAAGSPTPGSRYMISRDDTLWEIAKTAKPGGVSVQQEMLEIQRLNPNAFIHGNINRIKAGYIIYLPTGDDISSLDESTAAAEVREQNAAWREGREAQRYERGGPSLRISADESAEEDASTPPVQDGIALSGTGELTDDAQRGGELSESGEAVSLGEADGDSSLSATEREVETLKRIVSLKDEQIAALQAALADAGVDAEAGTDFLAAEVEGLAESLEGTEGEGLVGDVLEGPDTAEIDEAMSGQAPGIPDAGLEETVDAAELTEGEALVGLDEELSDEFDNAESVLDEAVSDLEEGGVSETVEAAVEEPAIEEQAATPVQKPEASPEPASSGESGSWASNLLYVLGALVAGVLFFVFLRRRGQDDDVVAPAASTQAPKADVFNDVQLKQQSIEVASAAEEEAGSEQETPASDSRGYGERKHDEYASDIDASDALAEADIYIAYGRHPQAIDLLNNALNTEPDNPVYRLKLLEIFTDLNDKGSAATQMEKIQAIGDADSIARAEAIAAQAPSDAPAAPAPEPVPAAPASSGDSGLSPNPYVSDGEKGGELESEFSGLEIEEQSAEGTEHDLDLSVDFDSGDSEVGDEEELVIGDDSNGLSTKLDLARAYLDMGDDDGARQILDEVVAEGSEDLKAEARALLDRIGD